MPAGGYTIDVKGLPELRQALKEVDGGLQDFRGALKWVAEPVAVDAVARGARYAQIGPIKPRLRGGRGVDVEQTAGKVTGGRGDFGALQMRTVLEPALDAEEGEVVQRYEEVIEGLIDKAGL